MHMPRSTNPEKPLVVSRDSSDDQFLEHMVAAAEDDNEQARPVAALDEGDGVLDYHLGHGIRALGGSPEERVEHKLLVLGEIQDGVLDQLRAGGAPRKRPGAGVRVARPSGARRGHGSRGAEVLEDRGVTAAEMIARDVPFVEHPTAARYPRRRRRHRGDLLHHER